MTCAELANVSVSALIVLCAAVFVVTYHRKAAWRASPVGWYLMTFAGAIGGLGLYTVAITITGTDGAAASALRLVRTALLLVVAVLLIQATRMVLRVQRRKEESDADPPSPPAPPTA
ncbi:hypothetical protein ACFC0S_16690 [Streptomyces sp. NPDC056084]|uniref:putative phage holin n=1 Tax=unclassified Streptomyces TaxID=2593676 RepID=UPI0035D831A1